MRRFLKILGGVTLVALLALAVLPWWLGPVLGGVASHYHATFARYERLGYGRFALHDVVLDLPTVRVTIERAETITPLAWTFGWMRGKPGPVVATKWRVEVKPRASTSTVAPAVTDPN